MNKEEQILHYMKSLDISREEAEQLFEDDQEDFIGEEAEEMTKKAKEVIKTIHKAGDKTERKKVERERKPNDEKRFLIEMFAETLKNEKIPFEITNEEKYVSFTYEGKKFELNLIQKREPKKPK